MMKQISILILVFMSSLTILAQNKESDRVRQTAELFVAAYNAEDSVRVDKEFNSQMRAAIPSQQFVEFMSNTASNYGKILKLESPRILDAKSAIFPAIFERGKLDLLLVLDGDGKIAGLRLSPPRAAQPLKITMARSETKLDLPSKGEWFIVWGGDTPEQNQHQNAPNQRFAFDILKLNEVGSSHREKGLQNEDYYAFGQEIVAPADGIIPTWLTV